MKSQVSEHGLDGVEIFRDLEDAERARLAAELETLNLKRGDVLVRQGEMADALYVVVTGRFSVTVAGRRQMITELGPGQPVGEIAFLAGGVRTATVTALRDSLVLRLGRAEFEELSSKNPSIWHTLTVTLARRVADTNITRAPPPDPRPRTITLIRAGSSELPAGFIVGLARVFRRSNRTMLVWPEMARTVLPASVPIDSTEATRALNALEAKYDMCCSSPSRS
jgi:NTE family protein